jgi:hypothetical protein
VAFQRRKKSCKKKIDEGNNKTMIFSVLYGISAYTVLEGRITGGFLDLFFMYVLYSTLIHMPPLRSHCVGGCCDRTQDCCDFGIGSQTL